MAHVIERAASGRAKCRACMAKIAGAELRFGERVPNPYADDGGETTHWFHVACGAFARPESFLEALNGAPEDVPDREHLEHEARLGVAHRRLPRVRAAARASTGRATCRACKAPIPKGEWRLALEYYEDGRFSPSGFIHARCAASYLETTEVAERVKHFTPSLGEADLAEIRAEIQTELSGG